MNLLEMAQSYVRIQDDTEKDESWETPRQRAESVLAAFLRDQNVPVWNVKMVWVDGDNTRTQNSYFILEETADHYIEENYLRLAKAPVGPPTEVTKCLTPIR